MKFAIVNNRRSVATPGLRGKCPLCGSIMIARCGTQRIWHWAHHNQSKCDHWWSNETEWHRRWKANFPEEWQEFVMKSSSGEKHIADVKTDNGVVIEFQHSYIKKKEQEAREAFYGDMVWVVDGSRRSTDFDIFVKGIKSARMIADNKIYHLNSPQFGFPKEWVGSKVPVVLDFNDVGEVNSQNENLKSDLWCLLPDKINGLRVVVRISKKKFIERMTGETSIVDQRELNEHIRQYKEEMRRKEKEAIRYYRKKSSYNFSEFSRYRNIYKNGGSNWTKRTSEILFGPSKYKD